MACDKMDRNQTTPFLLNLFYRTGRHNSADDFHPLGPNPQHVEIYTWLSATLDEIGHLIADNLPQLLPDPAVGTRLDFELVFPDMRAPPRSDGYGAFQKKSLGSIVLNAGVNDTGDGSRTLADLKFVVGDWLDCAIFPPSANGDVAPPLRVSNRLGPGPRENGFGSSGYGGRRGGRGGGSIDTRGGVPPGEWRRGDPVPPAGGFGRRGGRGRGW